MKKLGKELEFISFIKRDGSGTIACGTSWDKNSKHPKTDDMSYLDEDHFDINAISITHKTYIASGFNTWVVKLKPEQPPADKIRELLLSYELRFTTKPVQNKYLEEANKRVDAYLESHPNHIIDSLKDLLK